MRLRRHAAACRQKAGPPPLSTGQRPSSGPRSKELLLKPNGTVQLIRRAETPEDYFATLEGFGYDLKP